LAFFGRYSKKPGNPRKPPFRQSGKKSPPQTSFFFLLSVLYVFLTQPYDFIEKIPPVRFFTFFTFFKNFFTPETLVGKGFLNNSQKNLKKNLKIPLIFQKKARY